MCIWPYSSAIWLPALKTTWSNEKSFIYLFLTYKFALTCFYFNNFLGTHFCDEMNTDIVTKCKQKPRVYREKKKGTERPDAHIVTHCLLYTQIWCTEKYIGMTERFNVRRKMKCDVLEGIIHLVFCRICVCCQFLFFSLLYYNIWYMKCYNGLNYINEVFTFLVFVLCLSWLHDNKHLRFKEVAQKW